MTYVSKLIVYEQHFKWGTGKMHFEITEIKIKK